MNKLKLLCLLAFAFFHATLVKAQSYPAPPNSYEDGMLYVKVKDTCYLEFPAFDSLPGFDTTQLVIGGINFNYFDISKIEKTFEILGQTNYKLQRIYTFYFPNNSLATALMDSLLSLPCVQYAEKVPKISMSTPYNPTDLRPQTGTDNQWYLYTIKAKEAWDVHHGPGTKEIKIAVVDDAIWLNHPELTNVIYTNTADPVDGIDNDNNGYKDDYQGWDAADNDNNPNPPATLPAGKSFTHGTHVAAIAGAQTDVGTPGMASIGFGVKIIPVKIGLDATAGLSNVYDGVQYAIKAGADVINMSWGGPGYSQTVEIIMDEARAKGIVLVAAAGNDSSTNMNYPASYASVISVGATDINDQMPVFSTHNTAIDVMAPGVDIYSALYDPTNTTIYGDLSGTSMAAPQVAGLCGLMLLYNPKLTPDALESCLKSNCDNINSLNAAYVGMIGSGRINAEKAMKCLQTAPQFEFSSNFQTVCKTKNVSFSCNFSSVKNGVSYSWSFPGGSPSTSTAANPVVSYANAGVYDVTLVVTNSVGSTTMTKSNYITVKNANGNYNYGIYADNNWYFSNGLHLQFSKDSSVNPLLKKEGKIISGFTGGEGVAAISNYDGQTLFYTDASNVYNRYHQLMSNGSGLGAVGVCTRDNILTLTQNSIVVPNPNECSSLYYLFHLTCDGLYYSVIDMDSSNGLGAVTIKNKQVGGKFTPTEKITAILHCDGVSVWVIVHELNTAVFRAHLVDINGVSNTPVISNVGAVHTNETGQMKGSPGGDKIAVAVGGFNTNQCQLFDFNKGSGKVTNPITFNSLGNSYGIEFSPDGSKVYMATGGSLLQYNLTGFSASTTPTTIVSGGPFGGSLDLGPNGKIYAAKTISNNNRFTALDEVSKPNSAGTACTLLHNSIPVQNGSGNDFFLWGLNNSFISKTLNYHKEINKTSYTVTICNGKTTTLDAGPGSLYEWETGQTTQKIVVNQPGEYPVIVTDANGCKTKVVFKAVADNFTLNLGPDITYNCGQTLNIPLDAGIGYASYKWSTGATGPSIIVTKPGVYWVEVITPGGCKLKDEIIVAVAPPLQSITRVTYICGSPGLNLDSILTMACVPVPGGTIGPWVESTTGLIVPILAVPTGDVTYTREYKDSNGCVYCMDVIDVTFEQTVNVTNVINLACEGDTITISPSNDPPCNTATAWTYSYPNGLSVYTQVPYSFSAPAKNGDSYKITSYLPNGCKCEYNLGVSVIGHTVKKDTIMVNCGQTINLEDYAAGKCPNNPNFVWGPTPNTQLSSSTVTVTQTTTFYRKSFGLFGCPECILELTVIVLRPMPASIIVDVPCGEEVNLEWLSGCSGAPGTYYWQEDVGIGPVFATSGIFRPTRNGTYYRTSLNDCPCDISVTINVINKQSQIIDFSDSICFGKPFNFKSLCPAIPVPLYYKLVDPLGNETISPAPDISKDVLLRGDYKIIAVYDGCECVTIYRNYKIGPPEFGTLNADTAFPQINFCKEMAAFNPLPACPGAVRYKWFNNNYSKSFDSPDGTLTDSQRIVLEYIDSVIWDHKLWRVAYDANGCIICKEQWNLGNGYYPDAITLSFFLNACEGQCYTFNLLNKNFPGIPRCQFNLSTYNPAISNVITTTYPDGTIRICMNANINPNFWIYFECQNPNNPCKFKISVNIIRASCKKGPDITTGINENKTFAVKVFPNPTTGTVTVDMEGSEGISKTIQVFDVLGRRVINTTVTDEQKELNLSELSKGVYTIRIESKEEIYTGKIVLK